MFNRLLKRKGQKGSKKVEDVSSSTINDECTDRSTQSVVSVLDTSFDKSRIAQVPLNLKAIGQEKKLAFLLENVFTIQECEDLIKVSEAKGYIAALLNAGGGREVYAPSVRDSLRCIIDNKEFVAILLERISEFLPQKFRGQELVDINERLRFLKYDPGNRFKSHMDGSYMRPDTSAQSLITLQIYLNGGFKGGETTFFNERQLKETLPVVPKPGMILVFQHDMLHEGSILKRGRKYTIRTDVMYTI